MNITEPSLELAPGWERVVYAAEQPPYLPLPVVRSTDAEVRVVSRWTPTPEEREQLARGADVFVTILTFGQPLQPQLVTIGGAPIYPIQPTLLVVSDGGLRETAIDAAAMVSSALDRLPVTHDAANVDRTIMPDGQQRQYLVLSDAERAKGFVRPVRRSYRHVGLRARCRKPADHSTPESPWVCTDFAGHEGECQAWAHPDHPMFKPGCGTVTTMGVALSETYARQPDFYSATFCAGCGTHLPVGEYGEFVWVEDGQRVGT